MRLTESSGGLSQISKLPDSQTDVATRDDGSTTLHRAAEGVDVAATDGYGWTALRYAAGEGHRDVVALLLDRMEGSDVAAKDEDERTALHRAALGGHRDIVALLLGRLEGADVAAKDGDGWTALHCAAQGGHGDVVALLESALEKESTSRIRGNANEDHQS